MIVGVELEAIRAEPHRFRIAVGGDLSPKTVRQETAAEPLEQRARPEGEEPLGEAASGRWRPRVQGPRRPRGITRPAVAR